jgi:apolipoprotein N-acyltransferase
LPEPNPVEALTERVSVWGRIRPLALAAAGGALCCLGFVGFGIWPLAFICLVPLWRALEETRRRPLRTSAAAGFTFGWVAYAGGYHWMWRIVDVFLGGNVLLGAPLWVADSFWFALRFALYAVLYQLVRRRGWPIAPAGVTALLVIEWLYPQLFSYHFGHALAERISLIQISDLGGPLLLSAFLALLNAVAFETWRWQRRQRALPLWTGTFGALALAATWAYGAARIEQIEGRIAGSRALRVGVVQGNLGVLEKGNQAVRDHHRYLEQSRELLAEGELDLVVWPETVYTRGLLGPLPISGRLVREELRVPLLFGAAYVRADSGRRRKYNSALLVGADDVIRHGYDKNLLIPLTEYIPFAESASSLAEWFENASEFTAATETPTLTLGAWRISTPICYEVVRPSFVRRMVRSGDPHLIVTLANDSWFGDSQEPWIHLAMAKMRAVEHRRYLVRSTNSGVSAVVDPLGRELARTGVLTRESLRATVYMLGGTTWYTVWGDWAGWVAGAMLLAMLAMRNPLRVATPLVGQKGHPF